MHDAIFPERLNGLLYIRWLESDDNLRIIERHMSGMSGMPACIICIPELDNGFLHRHTISRESKDFRVLGRQVI